MDPNRVESGLMRPKLLNEVVRREGRRSKLMKGVDLDFALYRVWEEVGVEGWMWLSSNLA
jgi:hypothetical protein